MKFVCPKCMGALAVGESGAAVCPAGHSFDRSREGYYNLLLSGTGGTHGDNREMVGARRAFLDTGAYLPLAEAASRLVCENFRAGDALLDVGLGEGYYTDIIEKSLAEKFGEDNYGSISGFDISKDAVKMAARRNKRLSLAVASAYRMPIPDSSFEVVTNLFSPLAREEILRVLAPRGKFIMAIPGENHLFGLKSAIYDTPYRNEVADSALEGFSLLSSEKIAYTLTLDSQEKIRSLFMMTPYAYRTGRVERERVFALESIETEIEFWLFLYEKR